MCDLDQQGIADVVAVAVVDLLETVQIDEEQRCGLHLVGIRAEAQLQAFVERLAVAQAGEGVAVGQVVQLLLVGHLFGDVVEDAAMADELAGAAAHRRQMRLEMAVAAVGGAQDRVQRAAARAVRRRQKFVQTVRVVALAEQFLQAAFAQSVGRAGEQFAQCPVAAGEATGAVDFEIAVADVVENGLVAVLALRQAFQHVVQVAGELAEFVVAQGAELGPRRVRADAFHLVVQAADAAQNPAVQSDVNQHDGDCRHAAGEQEEEAHGVMPLKVEGARRADAQSDFGLVEPVVEQQVDMFLVAAHQLARAELHGGACQVLLAGYRLHVAAPGLGRYHAQLAADETLQAVNTLRDEEAPGDGVSHRRCRTQDVADRAAHQHHRNAADADQLCGAGVCRVLHLQQAEMDAALDDVGTQLLLPGVDAIREQLVHVGHGPVFADDPAAGVEIQQEVEVLIADLLAIVIGRSRQAAVGVLDRPVGLLGKRVAAQYVEAAADEAVDLQREVVRLVDQLAFVVAVEARQQQGVGQGIDDQQGRQHERNRKA
ncbi:hypothetical protein D9M69_417150 [compost metagenome]